MGLMTKTALSQAGKAADAVGEIAEQLGGADLKAIMLFVSSDYDLQDLSLSLRQTFSIPVFGCTTAGHIGPGGYLQGGLQATGFFGDSIDVTLELIQPLEHCQSLVSSMAQRLVPPSVTSSRQRFGVLFVDGLSLMEERLVASLHHCLPGIPLVGGSAGDNLRFEQTFIYADGQFMTDAAVLALFETSTSVAAFKFQHFVPTQELLVVTEADAQTRRGIEFNGEPAARVYARRLGLSVEQLSPEVFSSAPVMLKVGTDYYVRSIQQCNEDLSLSFYCAIAKGIVLRLGGAVNPLQTAEKAFSDIRHLVPNPSLIIGCDCILRRLEFEQIDLTDQVGDLMSRNNVVGFSTYGEQFNALHMNQTFTGLALGEL